MITIYDLDEMMKEISMQLVPLNRERVTKSSRGEIDFTLNKKVISLNEQLEILKKWRQNIIEQREALMNFIMKYPNRRFFKTSEEWIELKNALFGERT